MNKMQADEGSSTFELYKSFVNVFLYYIPINLKILKPWIFLNQHNFVALFVLTISIMILSVCYLFNTFAWKIFTKLLLLHFEFWIIWLGEILLRGHAQTMWTAMGGGGVSEMSTLLIKPI